ncbi:uncharacterized protein LOC128554845 isoform X1 [Mercenaria mercenaria]|uniref:uncharacterized protein LOC128554845 isoform X1 n=1 Tax=Mercenaria mercenaria TaxID=6596 RepID=UPI00234EE47A|nr:uncharacterized protein LOC128554845 isoform X1 [Mercenaria mercenaria]
MLIYVLDILLVLLQVFGIQASGRYFKLNKTWFEASKKCDMVMPNVKITSDKFVMDIQEQIDLDENGLWVGYFTMKTGFEYLGCSGKPRPTSDERTVWNTPGLCHTFCNKAAVIGISGHECFCLNGEPSRSDYTCNWSCKSHDWISCGGDNLQSVYRSSNEVFGKEATKWEKGDCLSFEYTDGKNKQFTWKSCSNYSRQLCYATDRLINGDGYGPWNVSVQHCLTPSSRPSYYKDLQDTNVSINPSWSAIIRSDVMYEYKDFKDSFTNVQYGYLTTDKKTSQFILMFTKDGKDTKKAALCQNKGFVENANDDQSSSKGVPVGVSVAVVLSAIAVASTIVVLKRRQKIPSLCRGIAKTKESGYTDSNNVTVRNPNVKTAFDNFGYSVAPKNSNASDEHQTINHTHAYFEHDRPETVSNTNEEKENDYNEITLDINATYDHADNKTKNGEQNTEHTYDTTKTPAIKRKEFADNNPDNFGDTGEDAYNHINEQPLKSSKTENVYGVPKQQENYSKGAGKSFDEDIRDTEDTYNHINEKPLKSDGTDNVYGLSSN